MQIFNDGGIVRRKECANAMTAVAICYNGSLADTDSETTSFEEYLLHVG